MVTSQNDYDPLPIAKAYTASKRRLLLLDYDGTLVDYAPTPDRAVPTAEVIATLKALSSDTKNRLVIISGRPHHSLDSWLGNLPVNLVAEHGAFNKIGAVWQANGSHVTDWQTHVSPVMEQAANASPGMFVERKITALVLHHRNAANRPSALKATKQAKLAIESLAPQFDLKVTYADEALEVRPTNISKGKNALTWLQGADYDFVLAAGDSVTDEDMFGLLPKSAYTIKIGKGKTSARYRIASPTDFVSFLKSLATPK